MFFDHNTIVLALRRIQTAQATISAAKLTMKTMRTPYTTFLYLCFLSLIICIPAHAKIQVESLDIIDPQGQYEYHFPLLHADNEEQQTTSKNINLYLQLAELTRTNLRPEKISFNLQELAPQLKFLAAKIQYQVNHQTQQYLSLSTLWQRSENDDNTPQKEQIEIHNYTFDLRTGQPITLNMLFTREGITWLNDQLEQQRSHAYKQIISALTRENNSAPSEKTQPLIDTLQDCLDWSVEETAATTGLTSDTGSLQILPDNTIAIEDTSTSCYAGQSTLQGRNNLKTWHNTFTYAELEPYFSDYGRCLLIEKQNNCSSRYQFQATPGIWKIPLAHGNQLLLIVAAYVPYYMDGMGDTLLAAVVYNQETSFQWLGVSNELRTLISDEQLAEPNDTAPLFVGTFKYTTEEQEEIAVRLGFFRNGQWKPYP